MPKYTYIDGIASSQALDTAGEIVDLKGLDISSLLGAAINWEHKKDVPAQIVGKILAVKKIYSEKDCENERHEYYWKKIQIPFLYIMARLFDDQKPSAMEVAALFRDDAAHPNEPDMLGFSVEGAKIEKQGAVITRSIARLVTLSHMPANKTCISEMMPEKKDRKKDSVDELFKGEMELFQFEPTYTEILEKKEEMKKDSGMSLGAEIGAMAMSEGWSSPEIKESSVTFNHKKHGRIKVSKTPHGSYEVHHNDKLVGVSPNIQKVGHYISKYMSGLKRQNEGLEKAMTAGSLNAAPGQLEGGAALSRESLEGKAHKVHSMSKKEKSYWFTRADEAYKIWDKRPKFQEYMKKRMPHLAAGEIDAIGRCLALKKTLNAENKLSQMYAGSYGVSQKNKKE